jgi:hypothetical protein
MKVVVKRTSTRRCKENLGSLKSIDESLKNATCLKIHRTKESKSLSTMSEAVSEPWSYENILVSNNA